MNALNGISLPKLRHAFVAVTRRAHAPRIRTSFEQRPCLPWHIQSFAQSRCLSNTRRHNVENKDASQGSSHVLPSAAEADARITPIAGKEDPQVHHVPDTQLPSHRLSQQWTFSRRIHALMDRAMAQFALASQRINNYTGTDYSGIEALRREIAEQEALVRSRYTALQDSKLALTAAQEKRTASSTELVALLERKHSWTSPDLEKYMALVRSEHTNDKAVQLAKEGMDRAEQVLEEARNRLERRERAQYHEEQIWSDTIRRNSTWVTIGLMGLNIAILLFNLVAIEPWRRKRLVQEVRNALEEKAVAPAEVAEIVGAVTADEPPIAAEIGPKEGAAAAISGPEDAPMFEAVVVSDATATSDNQPITWRRKIKDYIKGFFSEKVVSMPMIELSAMVIQAAAGGATVAWLLVLLMLV